ncbi:beta-lactamase [Fimbriimonas ginsengisoli Gsoil 348]|uniref:Beta-lactamase n=2 Tax=Fimbriimonas ginsengisoli TaxID=1005039 RepID=A0A068NW58_FIMGI|nr:beta-lactamase [Fimbriimonas ginsengisoli Gsoil 348]
MSMQHIPGLAFAVLKHGKLVRVGGYGTSNLESKRRVRPETVFLLGSLSKQFLAAATMLLVQDGKVRLDNPISQYVRGLPPSWQKITVRQVLSHTAGLVREAPGFDPSKPQTVAGVIAAAASTPLTSQPGSAWGYSNVGYYLVAQLLESVTHKSWTAYVRDRIFRPLRLANTSEVNWSQPAPGLAAGYEWGRGKFNPAEKWPSIRPSGAFQSSVLDLAKWDIALESDALLRPASRVAMWTPAKLLSGAACSYGFGWFVDSYRGYRHIHHGGGVPGYQSEFHRFPQSGLTVIVLANTVEVDLDRIALTVAGMVEPRLAVPPELPIVDDAPTESLRISRILGQLASGRVDHKEFSPQLAGLLEGDLRNGLANGMRTLGPIRSVSLMNRSQVPLGLSRRYRISRVRPFYETYVTCVYDKNGQIIRFSISD